MGKYLLVAEGPTDHVVINELADKLSAEHNKKIEIVELAPRADATSGNYPAFGWTAIEKWCKRYKHKAPQDVAAAPAPIRAALLRNNWRALIAIDGADGLIIQMDNDIAHEINATAPFTAGGNRSLHCHAAILSWLGEAALPAEMHLAIASMSTETWILASFDPDHNIFSDLAQPIKYEEIDNCEDRLVSLGFKSKKKNGRKRLLKSPYTVYEPYAKTISENLPTIRSRCPALDSLCTHISK
jgi:hypothetical protein